MNDHASRRVTRRRPRSGGESRRSTRKQWQQSGGGVFFFKTTIPADRLTDWSPALTGTEFEPLLDPFDDKNDESKGAAVKAFINMIAKQDELFEKAMTIMYNKVEVNPNSVTGVDLIGKLSTIDSNKERFIGYIQDVRNIVYFNKSANTAGTKFYNIITGTEKDPAPALLLYPSRVKNMFIYALASIFYQIKQNGALITPENLRNPIILSLLSRHYAAYVHEVSFQTTGTDLRDTVTNDTKVSELTIDNTEKFFTNFLGAICAYKELNQTLFDNAALAPTGPNQVLTIDEIKASGLEKRAVDGCKDFFNYNTASGYSSYAKVTASLLIEYCKIPLKTPWTITSLLDKFKTGSICNTGYVEATLANLKKPGASIPEAFWETPIPETNEVTLKMLFSQIDINILYFMLQLIHNVNLVDQEEAAAEETSDTTSSPELATKASSAPTTPSSPPGTEAGGGSSTTPPSSPETVAKATPLSAPTTTSGSGE
jgi:hypothetical protein